jgi:hypothetical protein
VKEVFDELDEGDKPIKNGPQPFAGITLENT